MSHQLFSSLASIVRVVVIASLGAAALSAGAAIAGQNASQSPAVTLELNKLEPVDKSCRAYVVVTNNDDVAYQTFKLDLVLFQTDGVIGRRFSLDLAPVRPKKKAVKLFEIDSIACDKIGQFLINDVLECKTERGPAEGCLQRLSTSTLTNVQLNK